MGSTQARNSHQLHGKCVCMYRVSQKKWAVAFFYYFPSKTAMTTIVTPLERRRAGKSFKKKKIFKKCFNSILRYLSWFLFFCFYNQNLVCIRKEQGPMLVNKQLGYKNNSNLANDVEIDEGYRQKKNYSFKSLFSLFSYEMFGCLFTLLNSDLKIWSVWYTIKISFNKKAHFFWLTRYLPPR